ncbi:LCP family protein [uncultured Amnibacterium sp.]|uniref:LCP family protein n=1 Tax=uncultured Amnibacterium sp. TaxID=1631851 RepID=UPI0035CAECCB
MTAIAAGGARAARPAGADLRRPDLRDAAFMTHRAWWLVGLHLLVPGGAQVVAGSRRLGRFALAVWLLLWLAAAVAVVLWFVLPGLLLTLPTTGPGLTVLQVLLAAWAIFWLVLTLDTLRLARVVRLRPAARPAVTVVLALALVIGSGGTAWGAYLAGVARGTIGHVFGGTRYALPAGGRYNVLLLGGDAGAGRLGLRPDSISVVSVDAITGATTMIGLPRDLDEIPFAKGSPMRTLYPQGYGTDNHCDVDVCMLNSIYTEAELYKRSLYPHAAAAHSSPGIEATREAVEGALGIHIQYYLLVDMGAMEHLIDALGGVTVHVRQRLPIGGGVTANGTLTGVHAWIEKGTHHLNGNRALWYARSRHSTSDYDRMRRQRELETALLKQASPATVLLKFEAITKAGSAAVKTDIPQGLLGEFTGLAVKARSAKIHTLELTPPTVPHPSHPDYAAIHRLVKTALR